MQRRARIKAVANLSTARKSANKTGAENQPLLKVEPKLEEEIPEQINSNGKLSQNQLDIKQDVVDSVSEARQWSTTFDTIDDVNKCDKRLDKLNEKSSENEEKFQRTATLEFKEHSNADPVCTKKEEAFKTPVNVPRAENESLAQPSKFRRPKIMPRLTVPRATVTSSTAVGPTIPKEQESDEHVKKAEDFFEPPSPQATTSVHVQNEQFHRQTESPMLMFSPPSTPFSPGHHSNRSRSDTPRDTSADSPGLIINHNLHYPPTPQSPFTPIPHSRMRTESICSLKSTTTVANLQPRKKVRTEDQKILDNKRESRERLSNKKIEKSQLRMFDMIYYNPSSNPMKPREVQKERSPKKLDLTAELPETTLSGESSEPSAAPVPQLVLNANGEMVLDETSLVVENEEQRKNRILLANTNVVIHDELSGSYGYYKRQQRTKEWPQDETIKFFRCLNTVGTDFSLMLNLFPNRSRRDLKLKFKKEEKNNPNLVDKALRNHSIFDIEELQRELEEEDEARRKEAENKSSEVKQLVKRKILSKQEAKAKAQQQVKSKIEKILSDGDLILSAVDNQALDIKENCENSTADTKVKPKRQAKRRRIKEETVELLPSPMKKIALDASSSIQSSEFLIIDSNVDNSLEIGMTQSFDAVITKKDEREAEIIHEFMASARKLDGDEGVLLGTTSDFISNVMNKEGEVIVQDFLQSEEKSAIPVTPPEGENDGFVCDRVLKREINEISESPIQFLMKQEACKAEAIQDELQPPQSVESQSLDDEAFLNSLDLERLVIVVKQVDGEDVYDIHETDATTQELSDKPLKLPRHIVDLIVSVMTQDD